MDKARRGWGGDEESSYPDIAPPSWLVCGRTELSLPGIWRIPVGGGKETPVLDHRGAGYWRSWAVTEQGIYFATAETANRPILEFFNFATRQVTPVTTLDKPISSRVWGLSVSPDRQWILYTQIDHQNSDIMLMENFR